MPSEIHHYLSVALKEEELLLHTKWLRSVSSEEYRAGINQMKELVQQHKVELWLIDSRLLGNIVFADQQWIRREIAPLINYSNLQRVARVLTEDVFNYISFENMIKQIKEENNTAVELEHFSSVDAALDWLRMD